MLHVYTFAAFTASSTLLHDVSTALVAMLPSDRVAMYKGTLRTVTAEVYVDDSLIVTWTSSGTTDSYESIDLSGLSGTVITLTGVLAGVSEWFSIVEVRHLQVTSAHDGSGNHQSST